MYLEGLAGIPEICRAHFSADLSPTEGNEAAPFFSDNSSVGSASPSWHRLLGSDFLFPSPKNTTNPVLVVCWARAVFPGFWIWFVSRKNRRVMIGLSHLQSDNFSLLWVIINSASRLISFHGYLQGNWLTMVVQLPFISGCVPPFSFSTSPGNIMKVTALKLRMWLYFDCMSNSRYGVTVLYFSEYTGKVSRNVGLVLNFWPLLCSVHWGAKWLELTLPLSAQHHRQIKEREGQAQWWGWSCRGDHGCLACLQLRWWGMTDWGSNLEPKVWGKGISKYSSHDGGDHICFLRGELHPFLLCIPHQFHSRGRCKLYFILMALPGDKWYFAPSTRKPLQKIGNTSRLFPNSAPGDILANVPSACALGDPAASNKCLCKT